MDNYVLCKKRIRSPLVLPSGIPATKVSTMQLLAWMIPEIGVLTTKSVSFLPKVGNAPPIFGKYKYASQSAINAVGLDNPGAQETARQLSSIRLPKDVFLMVSIFGSSVEDFVEAARILLPYADGFELNISCSHTKGFGLQIGQDLPLVVEIVKAVVALAKPVFIKASAKMDIKALVLATKGLGIAGYTLINSVGPEVFELDGRPLLTSKIGGSVSGRAILETALRCVKITRDLTDLTIIGGGGIFTAGDIVRFRSNGASLYFIGTACTGMSTNLLAQYFRALGQDFAMGGNRAGHLLDGVWEKLDQTMAYRKVEVAENRQLASDLFLLTLKQPFNVVGVGHEGKFAFAWIPGKGERPFSILTANPLSFLIQARGTCTNALSLLKPGESIHVRGPCGNIPNVSGKILLVGGGTGGAALYPFAERFGSNAIAVLGAKDQQHLYCELFTTHCAQVYPVTERGDNGHAQGRVTEYIEGRIASWEPDFILNCGPWPMIKEAVRIERKFRPDEQILSAVEFHTACGEGACGQCATPAGWRNCADGPFFTPSQLGL